MPRISDKKLQRIKENILLYLYENPAKPVFTSKIAEELIRDEEFILKLLKELSKEGFIDEINTNSNGKKFLSRRKWTLKSNVYSEYSKLINH